MNQVERNRIWRDENRDEVAAARRRYKAKNTEKHKARKVIQNRVSRGTLVKPAKCQSCSIACVTQAHHKDYSKPLEVMWLCRTCHAAEHRRERMVA